MLRLDRRTILVRLVDVGVRFLLVCVVFVSIGPRLPAEVSLPLDVVFWCYALTRPWAVLHEWLTVRYHISRAGVQLKTGVLVKRDLLVGWDEVVAVQLSRPAVHRLLGCVVVAVGVGSVQHKSLTIDAVSEDAARTIVEAYRRVELTAPGVATVEPPPIRAVYRARLRDYLLISITYGQFLLIVPLAVSSYLELSQWLALPAVDWSRWSAGLSTWPALVSGMVAVLVVSVVLGTVLAWFRYRTFLTTADNHALRISGGLISHEDRRIGHGAIEGLKLEQNPFMRLSGQARLSVITKQGGERMASNMIVPVARLADLAELTRNYFPHFCWLGHLPRRRLASVELVALVVLLLISGLPAAVLPPAPGRTEMLVLLAVLALLVANWFWSSTACVGDDLIVFRRGFLWTKTYVLQARHVHASTFRDGVLAGVTGRAGAALHFLERGPRAAHLVAAPRTEVSELRRRLMPRSTG